MVPIITAIIPGVVTLIGVLVSNYWANNKTLYRIDQLEEKVNKHNDLITRMFIAEGSIKVLDEKIKTTNKRIDILGEGQANRNTSGG